MPQLELKSSLIFLAIKRYQGTKSKKDIEQLRSSLKKLVHAPLGVTYPKLLSCLTGKYPNCCCYLWIMWD